MEIKKIGRKFIYRLTCDGGEEAIEYIEKVFMENPSDGRLYYHIAELLGGYISFSEEMALMDHAIHYFERALELMPEKAEQIYYRLMECYAKMGNEEKAELAWSHLQEHDVDKRWGHAEMLSSLKQYDKAVIEKEAYIFGKIEDLMDKLRSLSEDLSAQGDEELAEMAKEKAGEFKKLFGVRTVQDVLQEWIDASAEMRKDNYAKEINDYLIEEAIAGKVSTCPLFENITEEQVYGQK